MPAKKKDTKKVDVKPVKKETGYTLTININGVESKKTSVKDVAEAILDLKPEFVQGATKVTLKKGKYETTRTLFASAARRMFNNKVAAETFAKNLVRSIHG